MIGSRFIGLIELYYCRFFPLCYHYFRGISLLYELLVELIKIVLLYSCLHFWHASILCGYFRRIFYSFLPSLLYNIIFIFSWTDYLVDEGTECNSTFDLLLERNREQSLVDLLVPSLVLLITLLQKFQVCCLLVRLYPNEEDIFLSAKDIMKSFVDLWWDWGCYATHLV